MFFSCRKTTPPFENDLADRAHNCALRRNSVSPQDRFLEAWFSLFLRENIKVSRSPYPQKFTLSACAALRAEQSSRSRCAHRKAWFSVAGIKFYLGAASRCPQRLRSAALRLYEQTFHFYTKDIARGKRPPLFFCEKLMINAAKLLTGERHMIIMIIELSVIELS